MMSQEEDVQVNKFQKNTSSKKSTKDWQRASGNGQVYVLGS